MRLAELAHWLEINLLALGIEAVEAKAETRWILRHLGITPLCLHVDGFQEVEPGLQAKISTILQRRKAREPLQYILGTQSFYGLELQVGPEVLIPRPETEVLVELALSLLPADREVQLADVGTGSGAIALALAHALRQRTYPVKIWASDYSSAALKLARANARAHGLEDRINWLYGDALQPLIEKSLTLDLLVSNPPYIPLSRWQSLAPEVRDYEPKIALTPGEDGLYFYRLFAEQGPLVLKAGGWLLVELETTLAEKTRELFTSPFWSLPDLRCDLSGKTRFLLVQCVYSQV